MFVIRLKPVGHRADTETNNQVLQHHPGFDRRQA